MWKTIKGFENYKVSDKGEVVSVKRSFFKNGYLPDEEINLKVIKFGTVGYVGVSLFKDGKRKRERIHRLVAEAFLENLENKKCVNHKNGIKWDNRVENLEWCTHSENTKHSHRVLKRKPWVSPSIGLKGDAHWSSRSILQYDLEGNLVKEWSVMTGVKTLLGYDVSFIGKCARGLCEKAYGFKWKYKELELKLK